MKKMIAFAAAALLALPASALAVGGIVGQCADCHTMHNSEQNAPVALKGTSTTASATPNQNLLRMDCIACHANPDATGKLYTLDGGSVVPQVYHSATGDDLAAGNFRHIGVAGADATSPRKGHNVKDLFTGGDTNGVVAGGNPATAFAAPPGDMRGQSHGNFFSSTPETPFDLFTCAGAAGCHGTRNQALSFNTIPDENGNPSVDPASIVRRTGLAAVSGAHHNNYDGVKNAQQAVQGVHDGADVANSYRFIKGLKGTGSPVRWENQDASNHNEYFGAVATLGSGCGRCHVDGTVTAKSHLFTDGTLKVPNQSMSGFCITCHGNFHSMGSVATFQANGTSGAFLRHPSDYVIPDRGEYQAYTTYNVTAPVARPTLYDAADSTVAPGTDMVMCLSCHQAHATEFDGMLRFDYAAIIAGNTEDTNGCLACHTTKGVAK